MTTICVNMIVRNEAHIIARCLASVRRHITHWAIVDTGSTDGTQDIIRRELAGIPSELIERSWVDDFSVSRNQALEVAHASGAEWILFLDADEELIWPRRLGRLTDIPLQKGQCDLYRIPLRFVAPRQSIERPIVRAAIPCRWRWALHEELVFGGAPIRRGELDCEGYILNHDDAASVATGQAEKARKRAQRLETMLLEEPGCAHHWFYLGQELDLAKDVAGAIRAYERCAELAGESELTLASLFTVGNLQLRRGDPVEGALATFLEAHRRRPSRGEPLYMAAQILNVIGNHAQAERYARAAAALSEPTPSWFFPFGDQVHRWRAREEIAVAAAAQARLAEAIDLYRAVLKEPDLTPKERANIEAEIVTIRQQMTRNQASA